MAEISCIHHQPLTIMRTTFRSKAVVPVSSFILTNNRLTPSPPSLSYISSASRGCLTGTKRQFSIRTFRASSESTSSSSSFGSRFEESVKKTIAENLVVIYSKTWCSYSMEVKALFKRLAVEPLVIELDEMGSQGLQLQKLLERLTGQHTVPNVFIGGKHIGGCTDTVKLHRKGELVSLLAEAGVESSQSL